MTGRRPNEARYTGLEDEQLIAMGEVAVWAARVERTLALVVTALVSTETKAGNVVTRGMPFIRVLDLGTELAELRPPEDQVRKTYARLVAPLKTAMKNRNHLLHSEWTRPQQGPASAKLTQAKTTTDRVFPIKEIEEIANGLAVLAGELFLLLLVVHGKLHHLQ